MASGPVTIHLGRKWNYIPTTIAHIKIILDGEKLDTVQQNSV